MAETQAFRKHVLSTDHKPITVPGAGARTAATRSPALVKAMPWQRERENRQEAVRRTRQTAVLEGKAEQRKGVATLLRKGVQSTNQSLRFTRP